MKKSSSLISFLNVREKTRFFWRRIQLFAPFWFSHHPQCDNFASEIISIGRYRLCRGCTAVYSSALITSLLVIMLRPFNAWPLEHVGLMVLLISSPTWLGVLVRFKQRWIKDLIRVSLGIGWGMALAEMVVRPQLIEKIIMLIAMIVFYQAFKWVRRQRHRHVEDLLCPNCRQLTEEACLGTKALLEAERQYSRELSDYLQKILRERHQFPPFIAAEQKEKENRKNDASLDRS